MVVLGLNQNMNSDRIDRWAKVIFCTIFLTAFGTLRLAAGAIRDGYDVWDWFLMVCGTAAVSLAVAWFFIRD